MKKKLLYGLMGLLFALSLVGFVACDDDDDDDDDDTTQEYTAKMEEEGYEVTDSSAIEEADDSTVAQIVTAKELDGAESVVFVITYGSGSYRWFTICQNSTWVGKVEVGELSSGTYTLTLSSAGAYLESTYDSSVAEYINYDANLQWYCDTSSKDVDMIKWFSDDGIYAAKGASTTLQAVYIKYSSEDSDS